jgi:hypothetical protein
MHIHKPRNQRKVAEILHRSFRGNLTRPLHGDDAFAFDEHGGIALSIGRYDVS